MAFMRDANNLNWAFVSTYQGTASTGTVDAYTDLNDGEVVVLDRDNLITAGALSSGDEFKIAQRAGTELIVSPLFSFSTATALDYVDATQQVTTIGSNGTTTVGLGDFGIDDDTAAAAAVGNSYYVLIEKQDNDEANRSGYQPAITAQVKLTNPDGHTNAELLHVRLAELLREAIRKNDQLEACGSAGASRYVSVSVNSVGIADTTEYATTTENATCTFGSKTVTFAGTPAAEVQSPGNYLNIGGDLYRIASYASDVVTLDFPFAGTTGTFTAAATVGASNITVASEADVITATGVGLQITGTELHEFDVDRHRLYAESRFNVRFAKDGENVGAAITTTAAVEGVNDFRTVLTDFYTSQGQLGQRWVSDTPGVSRTVPATTATTTDAFNTNSVGFGLIDIPIEVSKNTLMWGTTSKQRVRLYLAFRDGTTDGINGESQTDMETVFGVPGVITDYSA